MFSKMLPTFPDPALLTLAAFFLLAAYLTDRCGSPPNPTPSGPAASLPKDDVEPGAGHIQGRRLVILFLWIWHVLLTVFDRSPPAILCPYSGNLSSSLFTWSPPTAAVLVAILLAAPIRLLAFRELGENFTFRLAKPKTLVKTGLYAYMQHPSYTSNWLVLTSNIALLLRLNGVLSCVLPDRVVRLGMGSGGVGVWPMLQVVMSVLVLISISFRVKNEEAMLKDKFGKEWDEYHQRTKRFVPGLF